MTGRAEIRWEQQAPDDGRTTVLNRLSLGGAVAGAALLAYAIVIGQQGLDLDVRLLTLAPFIGSWFVVLVVGLWQGLGYRLRSVAVLLAGYVVGGVLLARHGLSGSGGLWLAALPDANLPLDAPPSLLGGGKRARRRRELSCGSVDDAVE